jgi:hypothetical protein
MFIVGPSGTPLIGGIDYIFVALASFAAGQWLLRNRRWMKVIGPRRPVPLTS